MKKTEIVKSHDLIVRLNELEQAKALIVAINVLPSGYEIEYHEHEAREEQKELI